jgi:gamma-glutamyltranspeptidase
MLAAIAAALSAPQAPPPLAPVAPTEAAATAADPAFAGDGRLAVSARGDLWVLAGGEAGHWIRITSGPASDRQPAWTPDGSALVFTSDRSGTFDLWRVGVGPAGATGEPERLTSAPEWEGEPTVGPVGDIVFVRGAGPMARLVRRGADGVERPVTRGRDGAERWPAHAPDGRRLAYVTSGERGAALRLRWLDGDSATVVLRNRPAERPRWSPQGDRLVFAARGGSPGTWITPLDGEYVNLVANQAASAAWAPDGNVLALAELAPADGGYNGDPDRVGRRDLVNLAGDGRLWFVAAPEPPNAAARGGPPVPLDRAAVNGDAFDRMWERTANTYFSRSDDAPRFTGWELLRATYRPRALAARSDDELATVLYEMWRNRPPLARPAAGRAAVSSAHPIATAAGLEMLRQGGNVVDAAVAVSFALGVVEPDASGIGGYGQMLIQVGSLAAPALIEFMTRTPEDAGLSNAHLREGGNLPDDGPILANVPGAVAGMHLAWERFGSGKVTWADLVAPAIRAAEEGFPVSDGLATTLRVEREHFLKYQSSRALFFPNGQPLKAGETLRNPDLAGTLRAIADSGAGAFYRGGVARRLVQDLRGQGNAMRLTDLARYYAAEREPVSGSYRGYTVFSSTPPSAGGATLVAQLNLLEQFTAVRPYPDDAPTLHAMIEAWKLVPSGRGRIADPGLWPVRTDAFVSKDTARARWRCFEPERALRPAHLRGDTLRCGTSATVVPEPAEATCDAGAEDHCHQAGTTAFVVADADGNVVAVTQTLGTWGGNFYVTPGLGFLYNDKLGSYGDDPAQYGARLPNARHGSSLAPTIVFHGTGTGRRAVLGTGAAGNAWITSAVYSIVTGVVDQRLDPQHAVELPRFLLSQRRAAADRSGGFTVQVETGMAPAVLRRLEALGNQVQPISLGGELRMGYAALVVVGAGRAVAGADPRRSGTAGAVGCGGKESVGCQLDSYPR